MDFVYYDTDFGPTYDRTKAAFDPQMRPMNECINRDCSNVPRFYLIDVDGDTLHTHLCDDCVKEYEKEVYDDGGYREASDGSMVAIDPERARAALESGKVPLRVLYNLRPDPEFVS